MKRKKIIKGLICISILFCTSIHLFAQVAERERPKEWNDLVDGGRFRDRFLPMSKGIVVSEGNWGAHGVMKRYVDNGVEDTLRSYWGGNIIRAKDGDFHMYVCGWLESSAKGHMEWPNSTVYHAVSNNSIGPFKIKDTIGPGHNPEIFIAQDGKYVIYVIDGYYISNSYNGPWKYEKFDFDPRGRPILEGLSNLTFAKREDGSNLMVCRGGGVWFSETGTSPYRQVSDKRIYPAVDGEFEDPVVWRDHVQYHLIVNDWLGRIAFYLRSKDGVKWVTDPAEAYTPGIASHEDGTNEDWFKYERIKVLQDTFGRAYQANFAVIDTLKSEDRPNDKHSSKNISIPLNPGMLIEMMSSKFPNKDTKFIKVKILKEPGFDPSEELDIQSLRFGASSEVNFGRGSKPIDSKKTDGGVIVRFKNQGHGLTNDEFAPKIIGLSKSKKMLYGYTRVPWVKYNEAILSMNKPVLEKKDVVIVQVDNFGQVKSNKSRLELFRIVNQQKVLISSQNVNEIVPYGSTDVELNLLFPLSPDKYPMEIVIKENGIQKSTFGFDLQVE